MKKETGKPTPDQILHTIKGKPEFWFLPNDSHPQELAAIQHYSLVQPRTVFSESGNVRLMLKQETQSGNAIEKLNEDALMTLPMGQGRELFAVLDGASSQKDIDGLAKYGVSGAFYVSHLTSQGFPESASYAKLCKAKELTAGDIMRSVNTWLYRELPMVRGVSYEDVLTVPGMAATFALVDATKNEVTVAHVADTMACATYTNNEMVQLTVNQNQKFDDETMEVALGLAKKHGCTLAEVMVLPETKDVLKAHLQMSFRKKINTPGGCGILNGMPEMVENGHVHENRVPITDDLASIVLFSDGTLLPYLDRKYTTDISLGLLLHDALELDLVGNNFLLRGALSLMQDPNFDKVPRLKEIDDSSIMELQFI